MMPKFSIIISVYNTSKFLPKCFDSILSQSLDDYEIVVINDGSTDNSQKIIDKYVKRYKNKFKSFITENKGLSEARNLGIKNSSGEYFIFLDSDDYLEKNLIKNLSSNIDNNPDLIRYQVKTINNSYKVKERYHEKPFKGLNGVDAFNIIVDYHFIENATCYAYKKEFFVKNKFKFMKNIYHEDFALIPLVIIKASCVNSIDYIGYNYVQRNNSIMSNSDKDTKTKKVYDFLKGFDYLYSQISKIKNIDEEDKKTVYSYIANSTIIKSRELDEIELPQYIEELKKRQIYNLLLDDTFKRKLKKIILKTNFKLYLKLINR